MGVSEPMGLIRYPRSAEMITKQNSCEKSDLESPVSHCAALPGAVNDSEGSNMESLMYRRAAPLS
jgi:hypothetical protein